MIHDLNSIRKTWGQSMAALIKLTSGASSVKTCKQVFILFQFRKDLHS